MKWKLGFKSRKIKTGNEEEQLRVYWVNVLTQGLNVKGCQFSVSLSAKSGGCIHLLIIHTHICKHTTVYIHVTYMHTYTVYKTDSFRKKNKVGKK